MFEVAPSQSCVDFSFPSSSLDQAVSLIPSTVADEDPGLFDYEIVNICLKNANWYLDPRHMDGHQNVQVPESFAGAHLHMMLGTHDPKVSKLASSLYAAADILLEQFGRAGLYCSPEMAVRDVFRAVVRVRISNLRRALFSDYDRPEPPMEPPERDEAMKTAFVVAAAMGHDKIVRQMLHSGEIAANAWSKSLHSPLPPAIRHGYANITKVLLEFGFEIPSRPFGDDWCGPCGDMYTAVVTAAKNGYIGALEPLLERDITKELTHCVLDFAARFKHWDLVVQILDHHLTRDQWEITLTRRSDIPWVNTPVEYKLSTAQEVVLWAARDGKDDLLLRLLQSGLTARSNVTGTKLFPLQQAAEGGHLSTCQLILDNGAFDIDPGYIGDTHIRNRIDTLAIAVAKGGNVDILRLFKKVGLWSRTSALHFLPISAEYGNLEMAKYAVEHGMDMPVKEKTLPRGYLHHSPQSDKGKLCLHCVRSFYQQHLRRLAMLRAVAFGHTDVVRW